MLLKLALISSLLISSIVPSIFQFLCYLRIVFIAVSFKLRFKKIHIFEFSCYVLKPISSYRIFLFYFLTIFFFILQTWQNSPFSGFCWLDTQSVIQCSFVPCISNKQIDIEAWSNSLLGGAKGSLRYYCTLLPGATLQPVFSFLMILRVICGLRIVGLILALWSWSAFHLTALLTKMLTAITSLTFLKFCENWLQFVQVCNPTTGGSCKSRWTGVRTKVGV